MAEQTERQELALVKDWTQAPDGMSSQLDLTEDAWEFGPPPPRGLYDLKLYPAKECCKWGYIDPRDKNGGIYYTVNFESKIVSDNPDHDGIPVFGGVSTRIYRGKSISTAAGLVVKMGFKVQPNPITDRQLAQLCEKALKLEKVVKAELDWRGAYSYRDPKTGQEVWENVFNHYEEFPPDPEKPGMRKHLVTVANKVGGVAEVRAQLRIVRFFGKGDTLPTFTNGTLLVSAPKMVLQPPTPVQTPQFVQQPQPVSQPAFVAAPVNAVPSAPSGGELELLLES
jgi:hypothetical protein